MVVDVEVGAERLALLLIVRDRIGLKIFHTTGILAESFLGESFFGVLGAVQFRQFLDSSEYSGTRDLRKRQELERKEQKRQQQKQKQEEVAGYLSSFFQPDTEDSCSSDHASDREVLE